MQKMDLLSYKEILEKSTERKRQRMTHYKEVIDIVLKNIRGKCLEIGCGDGLWTVLLKKHSDGLVSIDLSEKGIKIAKELNKDVTFVLCDARKLPFKNESFDSICAMEIIEHLPVYTDHHIFLKEIKRILKEDGTLLISTPNKPLYKLHCKILPREKNFTHFSELNYFQFKSILKDHFLSVKIYGKFGWLSPLFRFLPIQFIHKFLSKLTPFCKQFFGICKNTKFSNFK